MKGDEGLSLVEVVVAAMLIGLALVPLMQLYPAVLDENREAETGMRLGTVAGQKMEETLTRLHSDINAVTSGRATCPDLPACRVEWEVATEATSPTQGVGSLRTVTVTACLDTDGDLSCGTGELQVRDDAKVTSRP